MKIPVDLKYTQDHEWVRTEGDHAIIGITEFAQQALGDIVFVQVETVGETLRKGETFGTIEAVKTVSDMFMPVDGEVFEFNESLADSPDILNKDPYGEGWIIKLSVSDPGQLDGLLSAAEYQKLLDTQ